MLNKSGLLIFVILFAYAASLTLAQQKTEQYYKLPSNYYKIEDRPGEITKEINLWGYVLKPGRYEVPIDANIIQLITYAGGPKDYADLEEIKLYRVKSDGGREIIEVNLEEPENTPNSMLTLYDEDTIYIDYTATASWKEIFGIIYGPLAILSSITVMVAYILQINK